MNPHSAKTSVNQIPALHKFTSTLGLSTFDFGAGKKGKIDDFYAAKPFRYIAYDPFNRSVSENSRAITEMYDDGTDIVTCANVLNVIEDEHLDNVLVNLYDFTFETDKQVCFVSVYHKAGLAKNRKVGNHFQRNEPIQWYIPHLKKYFGKVIRLGQFLCCEV